MSTKVDFNFDTDTIAKAYDNYLVPVLFEPWAEQLMNEYNSWKGKRVLDLATGTGVVVEQLIKRVGRYGKITAIDMNGQMLAIAKSKIETSLSCVEFIESSADSLEIANNAFDIIVCQQGYQFFPNKKKATDEIFRLLDNRGKVYISTWCSVSECKFFEAVCKTLEIMGEMDISNMLRVPFDLLQQEELIYHFNAARFKNINVTKQKKDLIIPGGLKAAIDIVYATPIAPKLLELSHESQLEFKQIFKVIIEDISDNNGNMGAMTSYLLTANK